MGQIVLTAIAAALFMAWGGAKAAASSLIGGAIGIAAGLAMVAFMFRGRAGADPQRIVRDAFKGELAKLGLTVVLFVLVLKFLELSALPLFVTYIATLSVHWVALLKS